MVIRPVLYKYSSGSKILLALTTFPLHPMNMSFMVEPFMARAISLLGLGAILKRANVRLEILIDMFPGGSPQSEMES